MFSVKPGIVFVGNCSSEPRSTTRWIALSYDQTFAPR